MLRIVIAAFLLISYSINIYGQDSASKTVKPADPSTQEMALRFQKQLKLWKRQFEIREDNIQKLFKLKSDIAIQESNNKLQKNFSEQIKAINSKMCKIESITNANDRVLSWHVDTLSLFAGTCIAVAGLFLGISAWQMYKKEKALCEELFKNLSARVDNKLGDWIQQKQKEFEEDLLILKTYCTLCHLMELTKPKPDMVYSLLGQLYHYEKPKLLYKPLCAQIISKNINAEITKLATQLLQKIKAIYPEL
jgi:hypothetical protein